MVADFIAELSVAGPVSVTRIGEALREELELDPDHPEMRELLRRLAEIGLLDT